MDELHAFRVGAEDQEADDDDQEPADEEEAPVAPNGEQ